VRRSGTACCTTNVAASVSEASSSALCEGKHAEEASSAGDKPDEEPAETAAEGAE